MNDPAANLFLIGVYTPMKAELTTEEMGPRFVRRSSALFATRSQSHEGRR
ncbi:hypothetical protein FHS21_005226 [Phyllobacterium trifolii]|uniref:Uncharacterized protein n=1 Tax=Phyllobacterium trifolii TaxID=300193 RepID=A0A839UCN4_9HYPH|nr:hypothetical protein [Phyllobacterium trifolii]